MYMRGAITSIKVPISPCLRVWMACSIATIAEQAVLQCWAALAAPFHRYSWQVAVAVNRVVSTDAAPEECFHITPFVVTEEEEQQQIVKLCPRKQDSHGILTT